MTGLWIVLGIHSFAILVLAIANIADYRRIRQLTAIVAGLASLSGDQ